MTSAGVVADGYTVELDVDLAGADRAEALYQIPGCLSLAIREVGVGGEADALREFDTLGNNYLNFPGDDGRVLVLEGVVGGPAGRVGLPLALLGGDRARVVLDWKDYRLSLVCGGRADFDFPWHRVPQWTPGAEAQILSPRVKAAAFVSPAKSASALGGFFAEGETLKGPIQYWTPAGHNAWVGDVALCRFWGRLHLFYLYDRRHHRSKGGKGGHFFAHISSADLTTWVQHAPAVTIDDWWQTVGTGTPFELDGKLHLAYGLHTSRFMPEEETTCPELDAYYRRHGRMGVFKFADLAGYPMGATYCSSADGIHFEPSRVLSTPPRTQRSATSTTDASVSSTATAARTASMSRTISATGRSRTVRCRSTATVRACSRGTAATTFCRASTAWPTARTASRGRM